MRLSSRTYGHLISGLSDHRAATELYEFLHGIADKVEKLEVDADAKNTPTPPQPADSVDPVAPVTPEPAPLAPAPEPTLAPEPGPSPAEPVAPADPATPAAS